MLVKQMFLHSLLVKFHHLQRSQQARSGLRACDCFLDFCQYFNLCIRFSLVHICTGKLAQWYVALIFLSYCSAFPATRNIGVSFRRRIVRMVYITSSGFNVIQPRIGLKSNTPTRQIYGDYIGPQVKGVIPIQSAFLCSKTQAVWSDRPKFAIYAYVCVDSKPRIRYYHHV